MATTVSTLKFDARKLLRIIEHARNSTDFSVGYEELSENVEKQPGFLLVHDRGVYLMSNGKPRDIVTENSSYVVYAEHCNPDEDEDWWENSRDLVGGDDFVEFIPFSEQLDELLNDCHRFRRLEIRLEGTSMSFVFNGQLPAETPNP